MGDLRYDESGAFHVGSFNGRSYFWPVSGLVKEIGMGVYLLRNK